MSKKVQKQETHDEKLLRTLKTFKSVTSGRRDPIDKELRKEISALIDGVKYDIDRRKREDEQHAELMRVGKCAADSLREMIAALECDYDRLEELRDTLADPEYVPTDDEKQEFVDMREDAGECTSQEDAKQRIQEDALSVEVRSDWHATGGDSEPTEFKILLSTGGPATQICGELSQGEPSRAWLEVQDWGTPWTEYREDGLKAVLLAYARCFYFGEG